MNKIEYLQERSMTEAECAKAPAVPDNAGYDLWFSYRNPDNEVITARCKTITDFIDAMGSDDQDLPMLDYESVQAVFSDDPDSTKTFRNVGELLDYCENMKRYEEILR
jgi:hypothetical protein